MSIAIPACENLKVFAFNMVGGVQVEEVADWVSSTALAHLVVFVLDFGDRDALVHRARVGGLLDRIGSLDKPLYELARRVHRMTGRRLTMVLAANNPSGLVAKLPEFCKVGNVWQGERVISDIKGRDHLWSFLAALESECKEVDDSILKYL